MPKVRDLESGPVSWPMIGSSPWRTHQDIAQGFVEEPVLACSPGEDRARQEYALQSDITYQVQRFGVGHQGTSGVVNFDDMDLTRAMDLIQRSQAAWLELPKVIRDRYQSWANVERAAATGELDQVLKAAGAAAGSSGAAPAASPSDSAAVPPA